MVNKYSRSFEVQSKLFKISTFYILYRASHLGYIITEHWVIGPNKFEPHYRDYGSDQNIRTKNFRTTERIVPSGTTVRATMLPNVWKRTSETYGNKQERRWPFGFNNPYFEYELEFSFWTNRVPLVHTFFEFSKYKIIFIPKWTKSLQILDLFCKFSGYIQTHSVFIKMGVTKVPFKT